MSTIIGAWQATEDDELHYYVHLSCGCTYPVVLEILDNTADVPCPLHEETRFTGEPPTPVFEDDSSDWEGEPH